MTYNELINGAKTNGYSIESIKKTELNRITTISNNNFKFIIHNDDKGIYRIDVYAYLNNEWHFVKKLYDSEIINNIAEVIAK